MQNGDLKPPKKNSEGLKLSSRVFGSLKRVRVRVRVRVGIHT